MSMKHKDNNKHSDEQEEKKVTAEEPVAQEEAMESSAEETPTTEESPEQPTDEAKVNELLDKMSELQDSYLRLRAEFDNYKKRTLREKADLMKYGAERTLVTMLDVLDDFDRAVESMDQAADVDAVKEGVVLVRDKFQSALRSQGVHEMTVVGETFDPELHEAVAMSDTEGDQKGKIIDCVMKGYVLNDKVIRHPKVVVGK